MGESRAEGFERHKDDSSLALALQGQQSGSRSVRSLVSREK